MGGRTATMAPMAPMITVHRLAHGDRLRARLRARLIADACDRVGLSRPEIYRRMKAGRFPRPIKARTCTERNTA